MKYDVSLEIKENDSLSKLLKNIEPLSTVLEFGCANGRMTRYMAEKLKCNVYIVEYDEEAYKDAIKYAKGGICSDIMEFKWKTAFGEKFDYVIFADVLEHLSNPQKVMEECKDVLKDTGYLFASIPNIGHNDVVIKLIQEKFEYTDIGLLDDTHIHFFAYDGLNIFFENSGYAIQKLDCTVIPTGCTEQFRDSAYQIDNVVLNEIKKRKSGEIYQFIVYAKKWEFSDGKRNFEREINKPYREAKVYIDTGHGFNESNVTLFKAYLNNENMYEFSGSISFPYKTKHVRFDLIEGQGCFITKCDFASVTGELEKVYSKNVKTTNGVFVIGDDPIIEIISKDAEFDCLKCNIQFDVCGEKYFDELNDSLLKMQSEIESLGDIQVKLNDEIQRSRNDLAEMQKKLDECMAERNEIVSILQSSLEDCRKERDITIASLQSNIESCNREREHGLETIKILEKELEFSKEERELLRADFEAISDMKDRQIDIIKKELLEQDNGSDELNKYKDRCGVLEARINRMENTLSWRLTKILRVLGSKFQK